MTSTTFFIFVYISVSVKFKNVLYTVQLNKDEEKPRRIVENLKQNYVFKKMAAISNTWCNYTNYIIKCSNYTYILQYVTINCGTQLLS